VATTSDEEARTYPGCTQAVDGGSEESGRGERKRRAEDRRGGEGMRIDGRLGSPYIHLPSMYVVDGNKWV
jgi:hypothetical protein